MRGKIISLFKLPPSDLRKQGVAYLFVHFVANTSIFVLASFLYDYFVLHAAWIVLLLVVATYLGGQYYEVRRARQKKQACQRGVLQHTRPTIILTRIRTLYSQSRRIALARGQFTYGGKRAIKRLRQEFVRGGKED